MDIKRILRIKEVEGKEKAREIKEIEKEIERLISEKEECERELKYLENLMLSSSDVFRLVSRQKAFINRISEIERKIKELEREKERKIEELRDIKREEKALNIIKESKDYEEYSRNVKIESLNSGFFFLIKKLKVLILIVPLLTFSQSAVQEKLKEEMKKTEEERLKEIERVIDEKLKKLIEERKRLEALRRKPLTEEEEKEVKKLIEIVSKTPADEAGAILNNVKPHIAAEILLRLKERKAGQILAAMDPEKAAIITEIIMERRRNAKKGED